jgi:AcrR family transcriptional regulator
MSREADASRSAILDAAETLLREKGARGTTVDAVARGAGCAKGLVHYHFGTKRALLKEIVARIADARERRWREALKAPTPQAAIDQTWQLLLREADDGTVRALISLGMERNPELQRVVEEGHSRLGRQLAEAVTGLLTHLGLELTIPPIQVGWMIAAVIQGMWLQLVMGTERELLADAYAAAWLGVLSLARPEV